MHKLPHPHPTLSAKESELSDIPIVTPPARSWFSFSSALLESLHVVTEPLTELN